MSKYGRYIKKNKNLFKPTKGENYIELQERVKTFFHSLFRLHYWMTWHYEDSILTKIVCGKCGKEWK